MKILLFACLATVGHAVILEKTPFKRLIPADVLRDFRESCFASTQCKVYGPGEGWSLAPFCGASRCVKLKSGRLAEEVTDCGPVIDLKATPGCQLLKDKADPKAAFPDCCPVYDCEEGTEVVYVNPPKSKKDEEIKDDHEVTKPAAAAAAAATSEPEKSEPKAEAKPEVKPEAETTDKTPADS